jgi:hypothetical protein
MEYGEAVDAAAKARHSSREANGLRPKRGHNKHPNAGKKRWKKPKSV